MDLNSAETRSISLHHKMLPWFTHLPKSHHLISALIFQKVRKSYVLGIIIITCYRLYKKFIHNNFLWCLPVFFIALTFVSSDSYIWWSLKCVFVCCTFVLIPCKWSPRIKFIFKHPSEHSFNDLVSSSFFSLRGNSRDLWRAWKEIYECCYMQC